MVRKINVVILVLLFISCSYNVKNNVIKVKVNDLINNYKRYDRKKVFLTGYIKSKYKIPFSDLYLIDFYDDTGYINILSIDPKTVDKNNEIDIIGKYYYISADISTKKIDEFLTDLEKYLSEDKKFDKQKTLNNIKFLRNFLKLFLKDTVLFYIILEENVSYKVM